jgi:RimJ/RimL family protein N-acetyltransferase
VLAVAEPAVRAAAQLTVSARGDMPAAYPAHLVEPAALADGTPVTLRPIRASDAALELAFLAGLSSQTRYQRVLSARQLLPGELRRLTRIDFARDMALIATIDVDGMEVMLGVARYVRHAETRAAEFAVVVGDAWQGRGLGEKLLRSLIAAAAGHGLRSLTGFTLSTNRPMLVLARKLGFTARLERGDATLTNLCLLIVAPTPPADAGTLNA